MYKLLFIVIFSIVSVNTFAQMWTLDKRVDPQYPYQAVKNNLEGCVVVQFFIDEKGQPQYVEPINSSVKDIFDGEAYKAVSKWRYSPTEHNPNALPERKVVRIDFALSKNPLINTQCHVMLTDEVNDIEQFRENRLLTPIDGRSDVTLKKSMVLISTVLSTTELKEFMLKLATIKKAEYSNQDVFQQIDGLNYYQILSAVSLSNEQEQSLEEKWQARVEQKIDTIPLVNTQEFVHLWEISDMPIMIEEKLYKEISYQLLKAEILVRSDGTAALISTCRSISDDIKTALNNAIADWRIHSKVSKPKAVRYIYYIPAPEEAGAYYDCEVNWHPGHQSEMPVIRVNR
ncbi:energy transducer TonB [Thalassotalea piscium]